MRSFNLQPSTFNTLMSVTLAEISPKLKEWFSPEDHEERKLPGGGKWFFVPWQRIRDRLDNVCPDWAASYSDPIECGRTADLNGIIVIRCRLTLCGVTREGVGNSENDAYRINEEKRYKGYGTPIERATADAFKQAAESFGVGAYLDLQKDQRDRFVKYMNKRGDGRAYKVAYDNGWVEGAKPPQTREPEKPANLLQVLSGGRGKPTAEKPKVQTHQKNQKSSPAASVATTTRPSLYPQQVGLINSICKVTEHSPEQIVAWCQNYNAQSPAQLSPEQCEQLAEALLVGWAKERFATEQNCRNSYRGKVKTLMASGVGLGDAIASWIESVQVTPVTSR